MDFPAPNMEKKFLLRPSSLQSSRNAQDISKFEYGSRKTTSYPRKYDKPEAAKCIPAAAKASRTNQRTGRPRQKMGGQVDSNKAELGSVVKCGGKKQNITHLMDWWGPWHHDRSNYGTSTCLKKRNNFAHLHHRFNKEHYLQANCQFVVRSGEDYECYRSNPDLLVEWGLIEEVLLRVTQPPLCPICLYTPTAAKITKCGHIYCFPCMLHYLALSDNKWRKCPICYDPVEKEDLKSVVALLQNDFNIGDEVEFQLMRRAKDSLIPLPVSQYDKYEHNGTDTCDNGNSSENTTKNCAISTNHPTTPISLSHTIHLCQHSPALSHTRLITANKDEVYKKVLKREISDIQHQLQVEGDEPEACFLQEAMKLLQERKRLLMGQQDTVYKDVQDSYEEEVYMGSLNYGNLDSSHSSISMGDTFNGQVEESLGSTFEDLHLGGVVGGTAISTGGDLATPANNKYSFYFYQSVCGAQSFMHSINTQMLIKEFGALKDAPSRIVAKVLEKESVTISNETRHKYKQLGHLPIASNLALLEVQLPNGVLSKETLEAFKSQLEYRSRRRCRRLREESKLQRKAKLEEDRIMGKGKAAKYNIGSQCQFPAVSYDTVPVDSDFPSELSCSIPLSESPSEVVPSNFPSFAQMTRDGQKQSNWPISTGGDSADKQTRWGKGMSAGTGIMAEEAGAKGGISSLPSYSSSSPSKYENEEDQFSLSFSPPEFSSSLQDAFAVALEAHRNSTANPGAKGKKGKKNKKKKF